MWHSDSFSWLRTHIDFLPCLVACIATRAGFICRFEGKMRLSGAGITLIGVLRGCFAKFVPGG